MTLVYHGVDVGFTVYHNKTVAATDMDKTMYVSTPGSGDAV